MKIALLTGGDDPNYAIPLTAALISKNVKVDFIGNDTMKSFDLFSDHRVRYLNLRGDQSESAAIFEKARRILFYYCRLLTYVAKTDKKIIHILWLNKFKHLDRILMNIYYKLNMKKVILTVHNVNTEARDGKDSFFNRMTLKFMYRIVDHLIVHTSKMKNDLIESFGINPDKITEIKFGLNDYIPQTGLSGGHSRKILGLSEKNKIILFFGRIAPYKGLDLLAKSLRPVVNQYPETKLVIAGKIERNCEHYWYSIEKIIDQNALDEFVVKKVNFIPEDEIEIFFKAADVLVLPYRSVFQSGPLFMAYLFGLPVIAANVGAFQDDIKAESTGYIFEAENYHDLSEKIFDYFRSRLFQNLEKNRREIIDYAKTEYSWDKNGDVIKNIYKNMF